MLAILGATGTIGRSLARALCGDPRGLVLFARQPETLAGEPFGGSVSLRSLDEFVAADFELVINAIGAGDPGLVAALGTKILEITELWDRRVLNTMAPRTRYVFLSSGAVYNRGSSKSATIRSDYITDASPYVMAKIASEKRHRRLSNRSILDVRVFSYVDTTLPREGHFFLCELAHSIRSRIPFKTSPAEMVRDYAGRVELAALIRCWEEAAVPNTALDLYTKAPARKRDILNLAQKRFGLEVIYCDDIAESSTGSTPVYTSQDHAAAALGYDPERTSLKVLGDFFDEIAEPLSSPQLS